MSTLDDTLCQIVNIQLSILLCVWLSCLLQFVSVDGRGCYHNAVDSGYNPTHIPPNSPCPHPVLLPHTTLGVHGSMQDPGQPPTSSQWQDRGLAAGEQEEDKETETAAKV